MRTIVEPPDQMRRKTRKWLTRGIDVLLLLVLGALPAVALAQEGASPAQRIARSNLVSEGIPEIPTQIRDRLKQYRNVRTASLVDWLPRSEGMLIATRFGETHQIHWVKEPGGARHQLTFFEEPVSGAAASPNPEIDGFLLRLDVGGSELYQIFFFDLRRGSYRMLTDGRSRNGGFLWANQGDRFVFYTTQRNGRDFDLHIRSPGELGSTPVLEAGGNWSALDWAPDDCELLVSRFISANESQLHILDLRSGVSRRLDSSPEKVAYAGALYAKDGRGIYFSSDRGGEFITLRYHDLKSGKTHPLTHHIPWNVETFTLSDDGRYLAFTTNEDGISRLRTLETETLREMPLPELPVGQVSGLRFRPGKEQLAMVLNTPKAPGDVYSLNLADGALVRWTFSEVGGLRTEELIEPELIRFATFDEVDGQRRTIPAFYYRPRGRGPFPVLIDIHGGPEAQARPTFRATIQYYLQEKAIAILQPNVRGSTGYGKSYMQLDDGYRREDALRDIGALLDWIAARPELDSDRVGVLGGSYGGYMVLAAMVRYGDRLRAGAESVGISHFVTFLENTKGYRRDLRRKEYGDESDPEMRAFLHRISPLTNAAKITKPLFVVQGLNDPRVPVAQSEQMIEVIQSNKGTVWYLLAKDEGHGFRKKSNRDHLSSAVALFIDKHLLDGLVTSSPGGG